VSEEASVDYEAVSADYLKHRALERTAGPLLLWGLGVGYVISGDYFGWNFGLNAGGWGGLALATIVIATMYVAMIFSIAEMATAMPVAGGPYAFARRALGPWGGYLTGLAVIIEYAVAPAAISLAIAGYVGGMFDDPPAWLPWVVPVIAYALCVAINLMGSKTSLSLLLVVTVISVLALLVWGAAMLPHFDAARLFDIAPQPGGSEFLPHGFAGVIAALPAACWFYLAVEGVPLAAEETRDPARDLPKGMIAAMLSLVAFSAIVLVLGPGAAGSSVLAQAPNPLPLAAEIVGSPAVFWITTVIGLVGTVASFFSIIFAYSRQIFALSRAGYLPRWLSKTNRHHAPHWALVVPAIAGYAAIAIVDVFRREGVATGDLLIQMAVFAALLSYVMMMLSHLVLRVRAPAMPRPYRTPLYPVTVVVALVLALLALSSTLFYSEAALFAVLGTSAVYAVGVLYFALWSRHRLVATAPEEEASLVRAAEAELDP
jgi:ethanolamine permease